MRETANAQSKCNSFLSMNQTPDALALATVYQPVTPSLGGSQVRQQRDCDRLRGLRDPAKALLWAGGRDVWSRA